MDVLLIREALHAADVNAEITVRRDGAEMLATIEDIDAGEAACPDLFMLDLNLPKYDGVSLLARIRQSPKCGNIPVLIVTSSDAPQDRERAASLGATEYFRKSSDFEEFMRLGKVVWALIGHGRLN